MPLKESDEPAGTSVVIMETTGEAGFEKMDDKEITDAEDGGSITSVRDFRTHMTIRTLSSITAGGIVGGT